MTTKQITRRQRTPSLELTRRVFVGNQCVEDNLAECVKVAIWNAIGDPSHGVAVTITGHSARLEGTVQTKAQRHAAEAAALSLPWVAMVDNRLDVGAASTLKDRQSAFDADQHEPTCA
jgi:osmotically-inducible protein OsmY